MKAEETAKLKQIAERFETGGKAVAVEPCGNGHIHTTYLVAFSSGEQYILQSINTSVFKDVDGLMDNIVKVTSFLRRRLEEQGKDVNRGTLTVIRAADGRPYLTDENGQAWRLYTNVNHVVTYEQADSPEVMYQAGLAIGRFQAFLADFSVGELHETIPDFHNTPRRYQDFEKAVSQDRCGRAASVAKEIAFVRARREEMSVFMDLRGQGRLPLRVTHNDPKLANILFDQTTHEAVCLCDLDTVMPGFAPFDFGDAIRSGASTASEDETDCEKVTVSLPLYQACLKGFLQGAKGRLTEEEISLFPLGAKLMTLECGMRFLADYLEGDIYFKTEREGQNLDRCRTQFKLVSDMERKWEKMSPQACLRGDCD
ncbi:MAG: aminoglycoside phosphotransferase family protein [Lachnospiraceae bacterium]|nr:aminoglycoside phosphotransferase family protein [Lachnospiraceae bacterium]